MIKARASSKVKGTMRVNHQQVTYELKQRVLCALNKLSDRDTYKIGVEELEKTIECLKPDGIAPFLSCILDTDAEQKNVVRKECIRLMGTLVNLHEELMGPHIGKMVSSIVKRLKDPDTVVKDASVETFGVLASKMVNDSEESEGAFVTLVKPLFEALGEQNKHLQSGAALCLARVIDCTNDPPTSILQKMLAKTIKMLKNSHFMAKPAVIELNRSIIQAGGAPTQSLLSSAMGSFQDALKKSDWNTRKAAAIALGNIASNGGSFQSPFKISCIRSLESCRFDKVKPVREMILHSLHLWKTLPGPDAPEPSETGSSAKESYFGGDSGDVFSSIEFGGKDGLLRNMGTSSMKKNIFSSRKICESYADNPQQCKKNDWNIEIALPRALNVSLADGPSEESEESSVTKTFGRVNSDVTSTQDNGFEYVSVDDGLETSSISNLVSDNFETKFVAVSNENYKEVGSMKLIVPTQKIAADETISEQRYPSRMQDRKSLDSTVTQLSSHAIPGCCSQTANEINSIRKQLSEIENNQSNLMDLIKMLTTATMESLSTIQSKVSSLEQVVDHIAQGMEYGGRNYDLAAGKLLKKCPSVASPRNSLCTPRPSVDIRTQRPSTLSKKNSDIWEENGFSSTRSSISSVTEKSSTKTSGKFNQRTSGLVQSVFNRGLVSAKQSNPDVTNIVWKIVKDYLQEGNLDSAYVEALNSGDEHLLFELVGRTGPVLQSLSQKTASEVLTILSFFFVERRFISLIIPWLRQVVDISTIRGPNYLVLSSKVKRDILLAIQETTNLSFSNPADRRTVIQLATKLHQIWGK